MEKADHNAKLLGRIYTIAWLIMLASLVAAALGMIISGDFDPLQPPNFSRILMHGYVLTVPVAIGVFSVMALSQKQRAVGSAGLVLTAIWAAFALI